MLFTTRNSASASAPSLDTLIAVSYTKLDTLSHLLSGSKDISDLLRRGVLLQNALEWGVQAREVERKQRTEESVFGLTRRKVQDREGGWRGVAFESGMDALFEDADEEDEDEDEDAIEIICDPNHTSNQIKPAGDTAEIVDPAMTHLIEEGEEAWFEQTWNELHSSTSPEARSMGITVMDQEHEQEAEVYAVEDDDSMFSLSPASSRGSSRSTTPSPPPSLLIEDIAPPPPSPKLRPTRIQDKLDGPVEKGTLPPALECGMSVGEVLELYDVLDDEDDEEMELGGTDIRPAQPIVNTISAVDIYSDESDFDSDIHNIDESDVPDLDSSDSEDEHDDHDPTHRSATPWLITPTEDVLDDFGSAGSFEDSHQYEFDHAEDEGMFAEQEKAKGRHAGTEGTRRRMIEVVR